VKPAYYQNQSSGRDRWMVSYVDVLTIMLILFVAMAAQALQSAPKPHPAAPVLAPAAVPEVKPPIPASSAAQAAIQEELEQAHLDVQLDSRGVVVSLPQALLFPPGEDRINADALRTVAAIGDVLGKIPNHVILVGHADAIPIHNRRFGNNWELAAARGLRLLELLESRYGIAESRLSVQSYGSNDPKSTNTTPDGRASNRRVEIVILDSAPGSTP
jgi:chemotaxis protein MotB